MLPLLLQPWRLQEASNYQHDLLLARERLYLEKLTSCKGMCFIEAWLTPLAL